MTQFDFLGQLPSPPSGVSGTELTDRVRSLWNAVLQLHRGAERPTYALDGQLWVKEVSASQWELTFWDGTQDTIWATIDPTSGETDFAVGDLVVSKKINTPVFALADGVTITPDLNDGSIQGVTLADNRTMALPANISAGDQLILIIKQDATGSRTLAWDASYKFAGGAAPTLTTDALGIDVVSVFYDGTDYLANFLGGFG
ncbi:MAG: hypothetical protein ACFB0F_07365 [Neomegalonema sp.]